MDGGDEGGPVTGTVLLAWIPHCLLGVFCFEIKHFPKFRWVQLLKNNYNRSQFCLPFSLRALGRKNIHKKTFTLMQHDELYEQKVEQMLDCVLNTG